MSKSPIDTLHHIHTGTNDVLKGYREMAVRAKPDIQTVIHRLIAMHEQHAAEQARELARMSETSKDDSSLQGTVNKVVVMLRDWVTDIDRDVLPAVRQGEESLREEYDKALRDDEVTQSASVAALLKSQVASIDREIAALPRH